MNFKVWIGINGLQQKKVAERLKISPSYLSEIIAGKKMATRGIARRIETLTKGEVSHSDLLSLAETLSNGHPSDTLQNLFLAHGSPLSPELRLDALQASQNIDELGNE
jgi:DNA-binding transcriptional regulator YdaS (Cro superfamily)